MAISLAAAAALAITLVLVVSISGGSNSVDNSSAAPSVKSTDASTACGVHYWGSTLVKGQPCTGNSH